MEENDLGFDGAAHEGDAGSQLTDFLTGKDSQPFKRDAREAARRFLTANVSFKEPACQAASPVVPGQGARIDAGRDHSPAISEPLLRQEIDPSHVETAQQPQHTLPQLLLQHSQQAASVQLEIAPLSLSTQVPSAWAAAPSSNSSNLTTHPSRFPSLGDAPSAPLLLPGGPPLLQQPMGTDSTTSTSQAPPLPTPIPLDISVPLPYQIQLPMISFLPLPLPHHTSASANSYQLLPQGRTVQRPWERTTTAQVTREVGGDEGEGSRAGSGFRLEGRRYEAVPAAESAGDMLVVHSEDTGRDAAADAVKREGRTGGEGGEARDVGRPVRSGGGQEGHEARSPGTTAQRGAALRTSRGRYKRGEDRAAEKKEREQIQGRIRELEGGVGRLQARLRSLREEQVLLTWTARVLAFREGFRKRMKGLSAELRGMEQGQSERSSAAKLPSSTVLDSLREMTLPEVCSRYTRFVDRVRGLLHCLDHSTSLPDRTQAEAELAQVMASSQPLVDALPLVNPRLVQQLMGARLDGQAQQAQQVVTAEREDYAQDRGVLLHAASTQQAQQQPGGCSDGFAEITRGDCLERCVHAVRRVELSCEQIAQLALLAQDTANWCVYGKAEQETLHPPLQDWPSQLDKPHQQQQCQAHTGEMKRTEGAGKVLAAVARDSASSSMPVVRCKREGGTGRVYSSREGLWVQLEFLGAAQQLLTPPQQARFLVTAWPSIPDAHSVVQAVLSKPV